METIESRNIDTKDRRLLCVLAQNCRMSYAVLGDALRLSADAARYRVLALERDQVISRYMLMVDARRLGFTRYHLLLHLDCGLRERESFVKKMSVHPFVMWINTFVGRYDLQIIIDARDGFQLNRIKEELFDACQHRVKHYTVLTHLSDVEFRNLIPHIDLNVRFDRLDDGSFAPLVTRRSFPVEPVFVPYQYGRFDLQLLKALADDPRASLAQIAADLGSNRVTIRRHILQLIKAGVIRSFATIVDNDRFGVVTYYLLVRLRQDTPRSALLKPFRRLNNIFYAGQMLGDYDLILYLNATNPIELNKSIDTFREALEAHILNYDLLVQEKVRHWRHFTPGILEDCLARVR